MDKNLNSFNFSKHKYWMINFIFAILSLVIITRALDCFNIYIGTDGVREIYLSWEFYNNIAFYRISSLFVLWYLLNCIFASKNRTLLVINYLLIVISVVYIGSKTKFLNFYYFDNVKTNFDFAINSLNNHPNIIKFYKLINILSILNTVQLVINLIPSIKNFKNKNGKALYGEIKEKKLIFPLVCFLIFMIVFIYYFGLGDLFPLY